MFLLLKLIIIKLIDNVFQIQLFLPQQIIFKMSSNQKKGKGKNKKGKGGNNTQNVGLVEVKQQASNIQDLRAPISRHQNQNDIKQEIQEVIKQEIQEAILPREENIKTENINLGQTSTIVTHVQNKNHQEDLENFQTQQTILDKKQSQAANEKNEVKQKEENSAQAIQQKNQRNVESSKVGATQNTEGKILQKEILAQREQQQNEHRNTTEFEVISSKDFTEIANQNGNDETTKIVDLTQNIQNQHKIAQAPFIGHQQEISDKIKIAESLEKDQQSNLLPVNQILVQQNQHKENEQRDQNQPQIDSEHQPRSQKIIVEPQEQTQLAQNPKQPQLQETINLLLINILPEVENQHQQIKLNNNGISDQIINNLPHEQPQQCQQPVPNVVHQQNKLQLDRSTQQILQIAQIQTQSQHQSLDQKHVEKTQNQEVIVKQSLPQNQKLSAQISTRDELVHHKPIQSITSNQIANQQQSQIVGSNENQHAVQSLDKLPFQHAEFPQIHHHQNQSTVVHLQSKDPSVDKQSDKIHPQPLRANEQLQVAEQQKLVIQQQKPIIKRQQSISQQKRSTYLQDPQQALQKRQNYQQKHHQPSNQIIIDLNKPIDEVFFPQNQLKIKQKPQEPLFRLVQSQEIVVNQSNQFVVANSIQCKAPSEEIIVGKQSLSFSDLNFSIDQEFPVSASQEHHAESYSNANSKLQQHVTEPNSSLNHPKSIEQSLESQPLNLLKQQVQQPHLESHPIQILEEKNHSILPINNVENEQFYSIIPQQNQQSILIFKEIKDHFEQQIQHQLIADQPQQQEHHHQQQEHQHQQQKNQHQHQHQQQEHLQQQQEHQASAPIENIQIILKANQEPLHTQIQKNTESGSLVQQLLKEQPKDISNAISHQFINQQKKALSNIYAENVLHQVQYHNEEQKCIQENEERQSQKLLSQRVGGEPLEQQQISGSVRLIQPPVPKREEQSGEQDHKDPKKKSILQRLILPSIVGVVFVGVLWLTKNNKLGSIAAGVTTTAVGYILNS